MQGSKFYESAVLAIFGCALAVLVYCAYSRSTPEGGDELGATVSVAQKLSSHPLIRRWFGDEK